MIDKGIYNKGGNKSYEKEDKIMELDTITTLIGSLGFPIAACVFLAWFMTSQLKEFRKSIEANTEAVKELLIVMKSRQINVGDKT